MKNFIPKKMRLGAIFLLFGLGCFSLAQSQITVKGIVVDETKFPLPGVNITLKGAVKGTLSDLKGEFSIEAPNEEAVLYFSFDGYISREIAVGNQTNLIVTLQESSKELNEVVVVGYGTQRKSHLTGSISKIKSESFADAPVSSIEHALQGRIAGVNIQNITSEVGVAPEIRVRGMGSISASNAPLIVIDGYPVVDGLEFVDMQDVESIEVLKDAASAAIYGSRGANGVIIVTTKSGDIKKPKYSVKAFSGFKTPYKLHDMISAKEYVSMIQNEMRLGEEYYGAGNYLYKLTTAERSWGSIDNYTDWQREGLRNVALINNVQLSISGGTKEVKYYLSGSYTGDQGVMINNSFQKFNLRAKMDATLSKYVSAGLNIAPSYTQRETPSTNFIDFYRTYSWLPVKHTEATSEITGQPVGSYAHGRHFNNKYYTDPETGEIFQSSPWGTANNNPRAVMDNEKRLQNDYRTTANAYLTINIIKGLEFKTSNGFYIQYQDKDIYHNADAKSDGDANFATYNNKLYLDLLSENTLNYNTIIGKHEISALLGFTANMTTIKTVGIKGIGFPTDYVPTINAATGFVIEEANNLGEIERKTFTLKEKEALISVLGRVNYSYGDRYLFSASLRTDGSSKFGPENQFGWFPSVAVGWRPSEEAFLKDVNWISQLKLRASYGVTGNNDIVNYAAYDKLSPANYVFGTSGTLTPGLANTSDVLGNKAISWEQTDEYNCGFDFGLFNGRINLTFDYYYAITKSLLYSESALAITGYNKFWNNIGKVRNRGVEIELNTVNIKTKKFEWQTSINIAHNNNRLLELSSGQSELISKGERNEQYIAIVGQPSIQYYGFKTTGIWQTQEEIDAGPVYLEGKTVVPGTLKVEDYYEDGMIDNLDRQALGSPFPDFTWGMTNIFKYAGFELSILLQGSQGGKIFNGDGYYQETKRINKAFTENRWISPDYPGDGKTPHYANANGMLWEYTDYLLEDASYMSLRDVSLSYKFDSKILQKIRISSLRLYASGQNLLYVMGKGYRGINPEARRTSEWYQNPLISGYQRGSFPLQRTVTIGLELNF